jgi:hypothetical protein
MDELTPVGESVNDLRDEKGIYRHWRYRFKYKNDTGEDIREAYGISTLFFLFPFLSSTRRGVVWTEREEEGEKVVLCLLGPSVFSPLTSPVSSFLCLARYKKRSRVDLFSVGQAGKSGRGNRKLRKSGAYYHTRS